MIIDIIIVVCILWAIALVATWWDAIQQDRAIEKHNRAVQQQQKGRRLP